MVEDKRVLKQFHELLGQRKDIWSSWQTPQLISSELGSAQSVVDKVADLIGEGTHGPYFEVSRNRYAHYLAAAIATLPTKASVLDVGNAPGHVAIGFSLLGHDVRGLNLNADWRSTYPSEEWYEKFNVIEHDIEKAALPFAESSFDAVLFTEVLEHVGITHPSKIVAEICRVLKPGGVLIFSTPNVCNISNLYALLTGANIFWGPSIFYGSLDRHNREYTPREVDELMFGAGLKQVISWGLNDYSNWRADGAAFANEFIAEFGDNHPLCRNTIAGVYAKPMGDNRRT